MTTVVCALDSFKGSVTAAQASAAAAQGVRRALPHATVIVSPIADGGEGTVAALAPHGVMETRGATDLVGAPVEAPVAIIGDAVAVESAVTVGLGRLASIDPANARRAHSWGLGAHLADVLAHHRPATAFIALGGTGATDGGLGFLLALGARAWDEAGREIEAGPNAANPLLRRPRRVVLPGAPDAALVGLADVRSPLLGAEGAARLFGPQKGADPALIAELEGAMTGWAEALSAAGAPVADVPGAGAAGGLGAAILALGGTLEPGFERLAALTGLNAALAAADVVITGEGRLDAQSALGKAPVAAARMARAGAAARAGVTHVIALAGRVDHRHPEVFDQALEIHERPLPLEEAMDPAVASAAIARAAERALRGLANPSAR